MFHVFVAGCGTTGSQSAMSALDSRMTGPEPLDFIPGRDFLPADGGRDFLRPNYSNSTADRIREGVDCLAALCTEIKAG